MRNEKWEDGRDEYTVEVVVVSNESIISFVGRVWVVEKGGGGGNEWSA